MMEIKQIVADPSSKRYLIQMQTQSFLHGFHMHITVTEKSCPLCSGQELEDYIGAYSISFHVSVIDKYEEPTFLLHLYFTPSEFAVITSLVGSTVDSEVQLDFFFPKEEFSWYKKYDLFKNIFPDIIQRGEMQNISSTSWKYQFLKKQNVTSCLPIRSSMGKIIRHIGNASQFETTLSLSDECLQALEMSKLELRISESGRQKLKLICGKEIHMTIVYPYPIQDNVSTKLLKERKIITILVERAPHLFYSDEPTLYFDLHNPLTLPQISNESLIMQEFTQQLTLKAVDASGVLCSKDIFEYLATHASDKYFFIDFGDKHSVSVEKMMIVVHSVHINPYFGTPMMSLSHCLPQNFDVLIEINLATSFFKLTKGDWSPILVGKGQLKNIKQAFLHFKNSMRKNPNSPEIPFPVASHSLQQYFHHILIHPLYPNTQLDSVKSAVKMVLSLAAEKSGMKCHTFSLVESVPHEEKIVSTSTELQSQSHKECANCKIAQPNLKKCGACGKVQYCSKECQRVHWKKHKSNCKESSTPPTTTPTSCAQCKKQCICVPCSCGSVFYCSAECQRLDWPLHKDKCTSVKSKHASIEPDAEFGFSQEQETLDSQEQETLDFQEQETLDSQEQETLDSQEQETLDSQGQETLGSQEQETLDSEKEKETATSSALLSAPTGKTQDEKQICSSCKKTSTTLHRCSCHKVSYCTVECQTLDWPKYKGKCTNTPSAWSKNTSNEAISGYISSTEKKRQDTEGIEEGTIKPQESSAMHGSTHSLDTIQQHTSSITEI